MTAKERGGVGGSGLGRRLGLVVSELEAIANSGPLRLETVRGLDRLEGGFVIGI
jgi:hypothetical protein